MVNKDALFTSARTEKDDSRDQWRTPSWLFGALDREFKFTLDPASTPENHLCENYFCDMKQYPTAMGDGLISRWDGVAYVNPPFSQLRAWVKKGYEEAQADRATVVMLVPARTDTRAWWQYIRWGDVRFLPGRLKFEGGKHSAPFPSAVVVFKRGEFLHSPSTYYWDRRT